MDRTAIRFGPLVVDRWNCGAGSRGSARPNAGGPRAPAPALQPPRPAAPDVSPHGAHVQDKMIGYPENFVEPPLGHYVNEQLPCRSPRPIRTGLRSTAAISCPERTCSRRVGASRYNIMATRMPGWLGPITIEWTPEQPELAQSRRQAIVDILIKSGQPILAERVVIAPSPYPGAMGIEAVNNFTTTVTRSQLAASSLALPPTESASMGVR